MKPGFGNGAALTKQMGWDQGRVSMPSEDPLLCGSYPRGAPGKTLRLTKVSESTGFSFFNPLTHHFLNVFAVTAYSASDILSVNTI